MGRDSILKNLFALISDGKVKNVIVADHKFADRLPEQAIDVTEMPNRPGPGWTYDGDKFIEPIPVEPETELKPEPVESDAVKYLRTIDLETIPVDGLEFKELLKKIIEAIR